MRAPLALYRAITWRLWKEQRWAIVTLPLLLTVLFVAVVLIAQLRPALLTGPTLQALQAAARQDVPATGVPALARTFLEHQAPFLLALFAGLSAASVSARLISDDADRGSLELLLATQHDIRAVGSAMVLAASTLAGVSWAILALLSTACVQLLDSLLQLHLQVSFPAFAAAVGMQLGFSVLAAELTMICLLLVPSLARLRTGLTGDPMMLIGALPALVAFVAANWLPGLSVLRLSLASLAFGLTAWILGLAALRIWFRPEKFLES